jgi:hypothetical protein
MTNKPKSGGATDRLNALVRFSSLPFWAILELLALLCAWILLGLFPRATSAIMIWSDENIPDLKWYLRK